MTDEQTPDPHAALRLKLRARADHALGGHIRTEDLLVEAADALVQEKARADAVEEDRNGWEDTAQQNAMHAMTQRGRANKAEARADRLAAIVREARELLPLFDVLAQAETEGLL